MKIFLWYEGNLAYDVFGEVWDPQNRDLWSKCAATVEDFYVRIKERTKLQDTVLLAAVKNIFNIYCNF